MRFLEFGSRENSARGSNRVCPTPPHAKSLRELKRIFRIKRTDPDHLRWDLPNVLMTPHVGGNGGRELWRRMSELVRDNTRRYLSGAPLKHVVRTPDGTLQGFENRQTSDSQG